MPETIEIKRGETFVLTCQYLENDGVTPKSLSGVTLTSQVREKGDKLVATLTIAVLSSPAGTFTITATDGTGSWPIGLLSWDLKEIVGGVVRHTETATINVVRSITQ